MRKKKFFFCGKTNPLSISAPILHLKHIKGAYDFYLFIYFFASGDFEMNNNY